MSLRSVLFHHSFLNHSSTRLHPQEIEVTRKSFHIVKNDPADTIGDIKNFFMIVLPEASISAASALPARAALISRKVRG
jgi:hypothetical protein